MPEKVSEDSRITYRDIYTPGTCPQKMTQHFPVGSDAGSSDTDGTREDSVEGEELG